MLSGLGSSAPPAVLALVGGDMSYATARSLADAGVLQALPWPDEKAQLATRVGAMLDVPQAAQVHAVTVDERRADAPGPAGVDPSPVQDGYRPLFTDAPVPLLVASRVTSRLVVANDAATQLTGYALDELLALDIDDLFLEGHRLNVLAPVGAGPRGCRRRSSCRLLTRSGHVKQVEVTANDNMYDGEETVVLHIDETQNRSGRDHLLGDLLLRNSETGLAGRAVFCTRLERAIVARGAQDRIAVLLVELDEVASCADPGWLRTGGELMMHLALVLRGAVRASDTTAYMGDGRFAVLLEDMRSPRAAPIVAQRLCDEITHAVGEKGGSDLVVPAWLGLAFGDQVRTPDELLWRAEQAVSLARAGDPPGLVVFHSPLEGAVRRHTSLARDLRAEIARGPQCIEDGTLRVVYQPQVEIATRRVVGVEALVRWSHPTHGEVPPDTFIPIAEEAGLIGELDALVLRRTLAEAKSWGFAGLPLAVNVSGVELQDPAFADGVIELLKSTGIEDLHLELEITERVAIHPSSPAETNVSRLRAAGVAVSIDDFGTGPGGLSTLRAVAATRIKIDRSYIANISSGEARAVAAIVAIARGLGMDAVAEGVETPEQCAFLVGHGCLIAQGYLFAAPMEAADLLRYIGEAGIAVIGRVAPNASNVALSPA